MIGKIQEIKDRANLKFKAQDFESAIKIYTEAISLYQKEKCPRSGELDTLIGQVYTNRALMHHNVGDQSSAARDSTYVLENLDAKNTKALNRRAYAARTNQKWDEAVKDYQELNKVTGSNQPAVMKDLNFCMGKYMEKVK